MTDPLPLYWQHKHDQKSPAVQARDKRIAELEAEVERLRAIVAKFEEDRSNAVLDALDGPIR